MDPVDAEDACAGSMALDSPFSSDIESLHTLDASPTRVLRLV